MKTAQAPFFVERHSAYGHVFLPGSYQMASDAKALAQQFQQQETDETTVYLASDRHQDIIWEGRSLHAKRQ